MKHRPLSAVALLMALLALLAGRVAEAVIQTCPVPSQCERSDSALRPASCYPSTPSYFEDLSTAEVKAVLAYIKPLEKKLKLANASLLTNEAYGVSGLIIVDVWQAPKAEVLAYLDEGGPKPDRAAKVHATVLNKAGKLVRVAWKVGPLPKIKYITPIQVIQNKYELDVDWLVNVTKKIDNTNGTELNITWGYVQTIKPLIQSVFDGAIVKKECLAPGCLYPARWWYYSIDAGNGTFRYFTVWGLQYNNTDAKGNNEAGFFSWIWHIQFVFEYFVDKPFELAKIWCLGEYFDSAEQLRSFWDTGVLTPPTDADRTAKLMELRSKWKTTKLPLPVTKDDFLFASFRARPGPTRSPAKPLGPLPYEPYGHRFKITRKKIEWLGWSLEAGVGKYGPRFYDVRFKGERIAYEISVQEAIAGYSGPDFGTSRTLYFDGATYTTGYEALQLVHGIDCPLNSAYMDLDTAVHLDRDPNVQRRNLCVFEHDPGLPVVSHTFLDSYTGGGVRSAELVVRVKTTVGNYDYFWQLVLNIDGTLKGEMILTGFLQGENYVDYVQDKWVGGPVTKLHSGSLHDHTAIWKVDADIGGTKNDLIKSTIKPMEISDFVGTWQQKYIDKSKVTTEAGFRFNPETPSALYMQSATQTNKWGKPRGYSIAPTRLHYSVIPEGAPQIKGRQWVKYQVAVTKYKDDESQASMEPDPWFYSTPLLQFDDFLNKESIEGEDLVAWVTSGVYHIPHSEDAPVTPTSASPPPGFVLIPFNYFNENAAMDMPDLWYGTKDETVTLPGNRPLIQKYIAGGYTCLPKYEQQTLLRAAGVEE